MMAPPAASSGIILATLTAWAIDRKFEEVTVFSIIIAFLSLFGIAFSHNDIWLRWGAEHQTLKVYADGSGTNKDPELPRRPSTAGVGAWPSSWLPSSPPATSLSRRATSTPSSSRSPRIEDDAEDPYDYSVHAAQAGGGDPK